MQGVYEPIATDPLRSEVLNLELRQEDGMLRLYHPQTGERLPTSDEEAQARRAAEAARQAAERQLMIEVQARLAEEAARLAAEARAAQLEAEVARLRAELARLAGAQAPSELPSTEEA